MEKPSILRELRKQCGLSPEYVAVRLGVSRASVEGWERDANKIFAIQLFKLAWLYGVSADDLAGAVFEDPEAVKREMEEGRPQAAGK